MSKQRPVNLDLRTIKMPVTARASILHRISAVVLWVGMTFGLIALNISLDSKESFAGIYEALTSNFLAQFIAWGLLTALGYYSMATLKHVVQDMGHFEELESGKQIATVALGAGVFLSLMAGIWVWA
ncbi:MAG: succinate dehydrogenase, cytochrome b556 subunit [Marinobacterium sp.]|nr:succinate dehydrogenase, cytochrome b556 subunit [Marinobacterium sp.]